MKYLLINIVICLALSIIVLSDDPVERRWQKFKETYNKVYQLPQDEQFAFNNFINNLRSIVDFNAKSRGMRLDINSMSDLNLTAYNKLNGYKEASLDEVTRFGLKDLINYYGKRAGEDPPEERDWRKFFNVVGPVGRQGNCGSCWAFSTVGLLEGQEHWNSTGWVVPLSVQQLIDCSHLNYRCAGGSIFKALEYIKKAAGLETADDYPYESFTGQDDFPCRYDRYKSFLTTTRIENIELLQAGDEDLLKRTVAFYGPVAVAIDAKHTSFMHYKSGIYFEPDCTDDVSHAVLIVGYGTTPEGQDYWIIKNSYGTDWGMDGYGLFTRNKNHCAISNRATIATIKKPWHDNVNMSNM